MNYFFLHNRALNTRSFESFKLGVLDLMSIKKTENHIFLRNDACYENPFFLNDIFPNLHNNRNIFLIYDFFVKLSPCSVEIDSEDLANKFCESNKNGFLGVEFDGIAISEHKKISNHNLYENWIEFYRNQYEKLENLLTSSISSSRFKKGFSKLNEPLQQSIISRFQEAIERNYIIYPDTNIVKNVSVSEKCIVLELRIFNPVAIRVYFNFDGNTFYLASIENKSNPDQNQDIKTAEKLLLYLRDSNY